jgi:hypothetical protein
VNAIYSFVSLPLLFKFFLTSQKTKSPRQKATGSLFEITPAFSTFLERSN